MDAQILEITQKGEINFCTCGDLDVLKQGTTNDIVGVKDWIYLLDIMDSYN